VNPGLRNRCFRVLRRALPTYGILPRSYYPPGVTLSDTIPYTSGGFADIWKAQRDGNQVCVKAFRTQTAANLNRIKRVRCTVPMRARAQPNFNQGLYCEIAEWKHVSHPNVIPLLGVSESLLSFCIISPWLPNGNILEYSRKHGGANRLHLVSNHHNPRTQGAETQSLTACASCLWSRISAFTEHHTRWYSSGEQCGVF